MVATAYPPVRLKLAIKANCSKCGKEVPRGTVVLWDGDDGMFHMDCNHPDRKATSDEADSIRNEEARS